MMVSTKGRYALRVMVDLAEHGVFVGAQVGSRRFFEPDRAVSRGEFVTMALACAGIPAGDLTMTGFCDDAEIPTWAKGSAVSALQCGLIRGVGTEGGMAFCADEGVTLSEAAKACEPKQLTEMPRLAPRPSSERRFI